MTEYAYGKLNLSLDVLGKRDDGYHAMRMVMQSVRFGDEVEAELTEDGSFSLDPGKPYLPRDEKNLALRAARVFPLPAGTGARIRIRKRIPVCAGMAGGSADAAAVLRAMNRLTGETLDAAELMRLGAQVGSDVPYCLAGGTMLAEGRGEILSPLPALPECDIALCKPGFSVSTPELFRELDRRRIRIRPDTDGLIRALENGDLRQIGQYLFNVFEDALPRSCGREVAAIRSVLLDCGAVGACMTGTGSTVFGLFDRRNAAEEAVRRLRRDYSETHLTAPVGAAMTL